MAGAAAMNNYKMSFNEAWPSLQEEAINKLIHNLEVLEESQLNSQCFTSHDYMRLYTVVYIMYVTLIIRVLTLRNCMSNTKGHLKTTSLLRYYSTSRNL
ncbi:hypothetical protein BUALT_BualtUnG0010200 [Buddleja alternifolia]|uniref:Uncharacterized protein n=1 Tax=Buddleja alternifolia TaxID=168488 RepID=A0AAV6W3R3_9LAMI|nr:hypothetical protein BUALT_BualtUnG0010200 [Buddleja alternifolia]